ncbi:prolipoprotein diacylglyceryl transferase [Dethiobacter alkaliphilus]|uniref:Phosphatidylglycerol--prolipoprotein diacylglyceryl transferase n=1 Tax=Dethiobacter alkaliphilus AHT 1 TaxID=555088 RepID=C0GJQ2_DETAL|nr:prolipoprotein diacylglyceryl transferase [Dethiobacter alkaliphilus]EEG76474.1 prolipoprotein diacylglyceryl transferase [Dethiobacter alkaliphilus AHT 1]
MHPILFEVGGLSVYGYGAMLAIAFAVGVWGLTREGKRAGLSEDRLFEMVIWIMIAAILGSRILYILLELPRYLADPITVFHVRSGGLSFHGGLIAGIAVGIWYSRRHNMPPGKVADLVAPFLMLGYGIVRIGCLLNGCCFGRRSDVAWALPASYVDDALRHPTQLYAFLASMLIFAVLMWRRNKTRFDGQLFLEFILYYSIYRFVVEHFREVSAYAGFLTLGQAVSLIGAVGAFVAIRIWPLGRKA